MIREYQEYDLKECAEILMAVYNNELWQCYWSLETAMDYLKDYADYKKFVGYVLVIDHTIQGVIFCHEKIWWNNSELFLDEMFIAPALQRQGYGMQLLKTAENYVTKKQMAGITLSTNRYAPSPDFYRKNNFADAEHVLFMFKEM